MPFITEELWHAMGKRNHDIIIAQWPNPRADRDAEAASEIGWLITLITETRAARSELNIPPGAQLSLFVRDAAPETIEKLERQAAALARVGRIKSISTNPAPKGSAVQIPVEEATYVIPLEGVIDLDAEKARLTKALETVEKESASLDKRLSNPQFIKKARPETVEKARVDHAGKQAEAERLKAALDRLDWPTGYDKSHFGIKSR